MANNKRYLPAAAVLANPDNAGNRKKKAIGLKSIEYGS